MLMDFDPRTNGTNGRAPIALRWWFDSDGSFHSGWPQPGGEDDCLAIGWVASDRPLGVIENTGGSIDEELLDRLDERFPGRRWFTGEWDESAGRRTRAADQRNGSRRRAA